MTIRRGPSNRISTFANAMATHPLLQTSVMAAIQSTLPEVMEDLLSRLRPGELYEFYGPKATSMSRAEREQRISEALQAGQTPAEVGKREQLSPQHVRRIRARIGGGGRTF